MPDVVEISSLVREADAQRIWDKVGDVDFCYEYVLIAFSAMKGCSLLCLIYGIGLDQDF